MGALAPAFYAAKKNNAKYAFDAEDYHRGQISIISRESKNIVSIEDKYLPHVKYITAASPLIADKYKSLFPDKKVLVINNVFSKKYLSNNIYINYSSLQLFWFSQYLGINRGIETVIEAINLLPSYNITFHLLGECPEDYKNILNTLSLKKECLNFIPPVSPEEIFTIASQYDVGMATDVPNNENRNICLANKLFSYLLAGNCIVASDTLAQKKFMEENPETGLIYKNNDACDLAKKLELLYNDRNLLLCYKKNSRQLAATKLNWENESKKLLENVKMVLSD